MIYIQKNKMVFNKKESDVQTPIGFNVFTLNCYCDEIPNSIINYEEINNKKKLYNLLKRGLTQLERNNRYKYESIGIIEACRMVLIDSKQYLHDNIGQADETSDYFIGDEIELFCKKNILYQKDYYLDMIRDFNSGKEHIKGIRNKLINLYKGKTKENYIIKTELYNRIKKNDQQLNMLQTKKEYLNEIIELYENNDDNEDYYINREPETIELILSNIKIRNNRIIDENIKYFEDQQQIIHLDYAMYYITKRANLEPIKNKILEYLI